MVFATGLPGGAVCACNGISRAAPNSTVPADFLRYFCHGEVRTCAGGRHQLDVKPVVPVVHCQGLGGEQFTKALPVDPGEAQQHFLFELYLHGGRRKLRQWACRCEDAQVHRRAQRGGGITLARLLAVVLEAAAGLETDGNALVVRRYIGGDGLDRILAFELAVERQRSPARSKMLEV